MPLAQVHEWLAAKARSGEILAADRGKRELLLAAGYPGRQSLRSFALGYFLLAPAGRQMEPPDVG